MEWPNRFKISVTSCSGQASPTVFHLASGSQLLASTGSVCFSGTKSTGLFQGELLAVMIPQLGQTVRSCILGLRARLQANLMLACCVATQQYMKDILRVQACFLYFFLPSSFRCSNRNSLSTSLERSRQRPVLSSGGSNEVLLPSTRAHQSPPFHQQCSQNWLSCSLPVLWSLSPRGTFPLLILGFP